MKIDKILVADDHELILFSIRSILSSRFEIKDENIATFTTSEQVLSTVKNTLYDLYILDLELRKLSGFDLIRSIREINKNARIIICTMHQEIWNVNRLLEMDIDGII